MYAPSSRSTAVAKEMACPVSTVSRALTRLEKHLAVLLVHRGPSGLVLTDAGKQYLQSCRRALQSLQHGRDVLEGHPSSPSGLLKVACPVTMARDAIAPLLKEFLERYPELRVEIEPYAPTWDQEPRDDVDVFFKLRAPKHSLRRVRPYPGTVRGLFASQNYLKDAGDLSTPDDLPLHNCVGSGPWKLSRGKKVVTPDILFRVVTSDPTVALKLALGGFGIVILPLWMAKSPEVRKAQVQILPQWVPEPINSLCVILEPSRLTPKVQVLLVFLDEYLGTDRDPRLKNDVAAGYFSDRSLTPTSGP
jgi:LysR family transcriptional activator of dmlA